MYLLDINNLTTNPTVRTFGLVGEVFRQYFGCRRDALDDRGRRMREGEVGCKWKRGSEKGKRMSITADLGNEMAHTILRMKVQLDERVLSMPSAHGSPIIRAQGYVHTNDGPDETLQTVRPPLPCVPTRHNDRVIILSSDRLSGRPWRLSSI